MVIHEFLLQVLVLGIIILGPYHSHAAEADYSITKPGCPSSCGNLSIPYPFGLRNSNSDCHLNLSSFIVDCDYSTDPPTPYMNSSSTLQISDISVEDHEMRISLPVNRECYNPSGIDRSLSLRPWIILANFPMSSTKNKFTVIGCDTLASLQDSSGEVYFGCMSSCGNASDFRRGLCNGMSCCEMSIPENFFTYNISITSFSNHSNVLDFNPCSYAFVVENGFYNFTKGDLSHLTFNRSTVVLDWAIGFRTCEMAKKNSTSYMCKKNTNCTNAKNGDGYKCACLKGYRGNPYLADGCHDIDECADPVKYPCKGRCHNIEGSYTCPCPKGVGTGIGAVVLLLLCWWSYKYIRRRREAKVKQKFFIRNGGFLLQQRLSPVEDNRMEKGKLFTSMELDTVTDHFNENRILGRGGQGTVYKGMLEDGTIIAVKKSKVIDTEQVEQFINEVFILSEINHRNVVKLLGFCLESEVPLLVYEFVPNGTLYQYLHDPNREFPISWEMRLRIANEVAKALSYLHSDAAIPIYHRDIKSSNILLDEKYQAKVADFGASKLIPIDQTHLTTVVQGTFGYLDPEYYQTSQFTGKSDVYSFGIVLVELLTGEKPISQLRAEECRNLASYFIISMDENHLFDVLDKEVLDHGDEKEIIAVSNLAKRCVRLQGRYRPTMKEVAMELERVRSLRNLTVIQQNKEEIDRIRTESIRALSAISMEMRLEGEVDLTSMDEDQSLLPPK
ncbi:hypothetical protein ACJRO7_020076 [Eucalyptus globulus]|uniref:Protein kinase domain-containing protein n=1 Tax=Eucalyptus globulus TaxID=34317 RepID=A0ABD3KKI2_EUCGL